MTETWAYQASNTIEISGDLTAKYWPNQLIKITQGTEKFFVVMAVSLVGGNTRLTVSGGGVYTLTSAAITVHHMTTNAAPVGLPVGFAVQGLAYGAASKDTPADDDIFSYWDSAASFIRKKITFANLKTALNLLYAPIAKGVTNGDSHDHAGGDGAELSQYAALAGRSGGQTIIGGTSLSDILGLGATADEFEFYYKGGAYSILYGRSNADRPGYHLLGLVNAGQLWIERYRSATDDWDRLLDIDGPTGRINAYGTGNVLPIYNSGSNALGAAIFRDRSTSADHRIALQLVKDFNDWGANDLSVALTFGHAGSFHPEHFYGTIRGGRNSGDGGAGYLALHAGGYGGIDHLKIVSVGGGSNYARIGINLSSPACALDLPNVDNAGDIRARYLYLYGNCSADSFTDRTDAFVGYALGAIEKIAANADGNIDHSTLPMFAVEPYQDETGEWWPGRSVNNMVSVLTTGMKQLIEKLAEKDEQIADLTIRLEKLEKKVEG